MQSSPPITTKITSNWILAKVRVPICWLDLLERECGMLGVDIVYLERRAKSMW